MRRRYLLLKRRRKLKEDGKKKKGGEEKLLRVCWNRYTRAHQQRSLLTQRGERTAVAFCVQIARTKRREAELGRKAFEPRRKYVLDVYLKLNVLFNLVTVKFLSMALKFPPSSSTNLYNMQREIVGKLLFEAHRRLFYFLQKKKKETGQRRLK